MKKVAIIGAGQLGSRHLQGLAQSNIDIAIEVVEPFETSRKTAESRFHEVENKDNVKSIVFFDSIDNLSDELDLVIVATGSDVRSKVVIELLIKKNVENLVLEKVLFQTIEEYDDIKKILNETKTNCWVNHPRRMFPAYQRLKSKLKDAKQVSYSVQGGNWGLGCNALHFIDHLAYLTDSSILSVSTDSLDDKIYDSKRGGFVEFNGLMTGRLDNHIFALHCNENFTPFSLKIVSDTLVANIDEANGELEILTKENNWMPEIVNEKILYFQSELSNKIVEEILINRVSALPTYEDAMRLHVPFIEALLKHMNKVNGLDNKRCPIT